MLYNLTNKGFTLLEILLVVLIIGIMTAVGTNIINSQSFERVILSQAQQFSSDLKFICEKAVLENQAFGIELHVSGYQVLRYQRPNWVLIEQQNQLQDNDGVSIDLLLEGLSQKIQSETDIEAEHLPHIICQSDGSFNAFELRFSAVDELIDSPDMTTYYALKTQSPWQLNGAWYEP